MAELPEGWTYPFKKETLDVNMVFAFTSRGNDIYWKLVNFLLQQCNIFKHCTYLCSISLWGPGAENLFASVLETKGDALFLVDSDVAPTAETPIKLLERDVDIVAAPTLMYDGANQEIHFNVHYDDRMKRVHTPQMGGLQKVFNTSWACVLIRRRVLEMFKQADESFTKWSPLIDEKWKELPPDSMFYEKAKAFGFDIHVDWDCEYATHHKYVALDAPTIERYVKKRLFDMSEADEVDRSVTVLRRHGALRPA